MYRYLLTRELNEDSLCNTKNTLQETEEKYTRLHGPYFDREINDIDVTLRKFPDYLYAAECMSEFM